MSPLASYLSTFRPHAARVAVAALLLAATAAIPGAAVALLGTTLERVLDRRDPALLALDAAGFAALLALQAALDLLRTRLTKGVAFDVASDARRRLFARLLRDRPGGTGARVALLLGEVDDLQYGVSALVTALRNPLQVALLAAVAATFAPSLAVFAPVLLPAVLLPSWLAGRGVRRAAAGARDARGALADAAHQALIGAQVLQAFGAEAREGERFARADEADRDARVRYETARIAPSAVGQVLTGLAVALLVWRGGTDVLAGRLGAGDLVGFTVALGLMNRPLAGLAEVWTLLQRSLAAHERVRAALDAPPPVESGTEPLPPGPLDLAWDGVHHAWGGPPVLRGASLRVGPGELVALTGPTGAGKSTLVALAARLADPDAGAVRIGGVDLRAARLDDVRRRVAIVDQECVLFGRTVAENLRLGRPEAGDDALLDALRAAGAEALVRALPGGLDHPVGELGRTLSGGERQRLGLARALVAGGDVLLLDEATNQVDEATRDAILGALLAHKAGRAVLWVTHDPAVARAADRVVRLDHGALA